jgi:hypothetical protein
VLSCDFSFIFETGEREIDERGCRRHRNGPRSATAGHDAPPREGYVYDVTRQNVPNPAWGLLSAPGNAEAFVYPNCTEGRVVADIVRLAKGHTEGLEPNVTEAMLRLMVAAKGGKIQQRP